jgi:membrane-associated phospholipid phosphatase
MRSGSPVFEAAAWKEAALLFRRRQPVTIPMIVLAAIVPFYLYIGHMVHNGIVHAPALDLDGAIAVQPAWAPVYLSLFLAALLPVAVIHEQELIRRTVLAWIFTWLVAYVVFLAYPTIGSRPAAVEGDGFLPWMLRAIYASDAPYNCLPSLHVAQCFLAAFAASRVHRGVGLAAAVWALGVGLSTLFTKQHYVLDVVSGFALATVAYLVFLRGYPLEKTPAAERRLAPLLAGWAVAAYAVMVGAMWIAYARGVVP